MRERKLANSRAYDEMGKRTRRRGEIEREDVMRGAIG